jgi:hypothetical protein
LSVAGTVGFAHVHCGPGSYSAAQLNINVIRACPDIWPVSENVRFTVTWAVRESISREGSGPRTRLHVRRLDRFPRSVVCAVRLTPMARQLRLSPVRLPHIAPTGPRPGLELGVRGQWR